jgi:hypothetical protein
MKPESCRETAGNSYSAERFSPRKISSFPEWETPLDNTFNHRRSEMCELFPIGGYVYVYTRQGWERAHT